MASRHRDASAPELLGGLVLAGVTLAGWALALPWASTLRASMWRAATVPLDRGDAAALLYSVACCAALLCFVLFQLTLRRLHSPAYPELSWSRRVFLASCAKDMLNAVATTPCAFLALFTLLDAPNATTCCADDAANLLALKMPAPAVVSCGITCGFFLSDCLVLWRYAPELGAEMGRLNVRLMWPHHALSLLIWPYAVTYGKSAIFVVYFLTTELSSIFLNLSAFASKGGIFGKRTETLCGGMLLLTFALWRIAPIPVVLYAYAAAHFTGSCGLSTAEWWVSALSVPIPLLLNAFFFRGLVRKAVRVHRGQTGKGEAKRLE